MKIMSRISNEIDNSPEAYPKPARGDDPLSDFANAIAGLGAAHALARCHLFVAPCGHDWPDRDGAPRSGLLSKVLRVLNRIWRRRSTIRHLEELSDDMLKDIGLHRSELRSLVRHPDDRFPRLRSES
jgi:uncharacterized protein YjiS (DUF1127 family)